MQYKTDRQEAKRVTKQAWAESAANRSRERGKQAVRKASRQGDIAAWGDDEYFEQGESTGGAAVDARTPEERDVARVARELATHQRLQQQLTSGTVSGGGDCHVVTCPAGWWGSLRASGLAATGTGTWPPRS